MGNTRLMSPDTCTHGLVQRNKFGTDERDGLEVCRGCGLPTPESLARANPVAQSRAAANLIPDDPILSSLRVIEAETKRQSQLLTVIQGAMLALTVAVVIFVLGFFLGWFTFTVEPGF